MSKAPFSKPNVNDVVSSSHIYKLRSSLNHWSRVRLSKSRNKHLFEMVVALLLLCLQLTACGNAAPSTTSSASPNSDTTSQPNTPPTASTPGSTSASTAGPTTGPTTGPTEEVQTPDPSSFSITIFEGIPFCSTVTAGQTDVSVSSLPSVKIAYGGSANPAPGPLNWTVSALAGETGQPSPCDKHQPLCTIASGNWLSFNPSSGSLSYNSPQQTVTIQASPTANMPVGVYCLKIQFCPCPVSSASNSTYAELVIVAASGPTVSNISPTNGPAAGGTTVTINGSGFIGAKDVSFGGIGATDYTVDSDTQITAVSPPGSGTVDVTVTRTGTSATGAADQFTYT